MNATATAASPHTVAYHRSACAVFRKTKELWGGLSNMAGGFPLTVAGVKILTSEALYQACRFPHRPDVQRLILDERSPMGAKMVGKPHRADTRADWEEVRVDVMRWCLQVKLKQHWSAFGELLRASAGREIVEDSHKDAFWGAKPSKSDPDVLIGQNVLGQLLNELRGELLTGTRTVTTLIAPLSIPDFRLVGAVIPVL